MRLIRHLDAFGVALGLCMATGCSDSPAPDTTPPDGVDDLSVLEATGHAILLTWTAPGDDGEDGRAAVYSVRYRQNPFPPDWSAATEVDSLAPPRVAGAMETVRVSDLEGDRVYQLAVRTGDEAGNWSEVSAPVVAQTGDPAPPARVNDLRAVDLSPHAFTLAFTAPGDDDMTGQAQVYEVRVSPALITEASWDRANPLPLVLPPQPAGTLVRVRVATFMPGSTVHIALKARDDGAQWSPLSNVPAVTLPEDTVPPGAIRDLSVTGAALHRALLHWTAPGNDGNEGRVDGYEIRYAEEPLTTRAAWPTARKLSVGAELALPGALQTVRVTGLPADRRLWIAVRAVDSARNLGDVSNTVSAFVGGTRTWLVRADGSGDAPTLQSAIDSTGSGDTVLVDPGTYREAIDFGGKDILVRGVMGSARTILDGSAFSEKPVVTFQSGETRAARLEGFTITGGNSGILIVDSEPSVVSNVLTTNHAYNRIRFGGGIYAEASGPVTRAPWIQGNVIRRNQAAEGGGGIFMRGTLAPQILDNEITSNICFYLHGGGICLLLDRSGSMVRGNSISNNTADGHGGGVYATSEGPDKEVFELSWNLIDNNFSGGQDPWNDGGGGVWLESTNAWVHHNTIVRNRGRSVNGLISGIATLKGVPIIEQNILAYTPWGGALMCLLTDVPIVRNNLAWMNADRNGYGYCPSWENNGNVVVDPRFCNPGAGDFHLQADSPALTHPAGPIGAYPTPGCSAQAK